MIIDGGTVKDLARAHVLISLDFEQEGTKKTMEQILAERWVSNQNLRDLVKEEADRMVSIRFLRYDENGNVYVFSKDEQESYSWQPVRLSNIFVNHLKKYLSLN